MVNTYVKVVKMNENVTVIMDVLLETTDRDQGQNSFWLSE